jgi:hypothetical protein
MVQPVLCAHRLNTSVRQKEPDLAADFFIYGDRIPNHMAILGVDCGIGNILEALVVSLVYSAECFEYYMGSTQFIF